MECEPLLIKQLSIMPRCVVMKFTVGAVCANFSSGVKGFTFLTMSHFDTGFDIFQMYLLGPVAGFLCSDLEDDLCRLNLILYRFLLSPITIAFMFVSEAKTSCFENNPFQFDEFVILS